MSHVAKKPAIAVHENCGKVAPIFQTFEQTLIRFITKKSRGEVDSRELLHEVYLKVHKHCDKLSEVKNVEAWLVTIARHTIVDLMRERQKFSHHLLPEIREELETDMYADLAACVPLMIDRLPEKYGEPLRDHELKGIPRKQLAVKYRLSDSGLKSRIRRGRKQLKALIQKHCTPMLEEDSPVCACGCQDETDTGRLKFDPCLQRQFRNGVSFNRV